MRVHVSLGWLVCIPTVVSCLQPLDTEAAGGSPLVPPSESDSGLSTVILRGPPPFGFFDPDGGIVTSEDACDATRAQARAILTKYCADCHGGRTPGERAGSPPFDFVLDPVKLGSTYTVNTTPPMLFVAAGDPEHSRLYLRARRGEMPPRAEVQLPRPGVSDISVLQHWIASCLGPKPPATGAGGATGSGGAAGASGSSGGGGVGGGGGPGGAGGSLGGRGGAGGAGGSGGSGGGSGDAGIRDAGAGGRSGEAGPVCAPPYLVSDCSSYVVGSEVSRNGINYTCSDPGCRMCAFDGRCSPGATGCRAGVVWRDDGPCTPR